MGSSHGDTSLLDYGILFQIISEILIVTAVLNVDSSSSTLQVYSPFRNLP